MSQVSDLGTWPAGSAANAIRPKQPGRYHNMTDAQLADEHRGQGFAERRAKEAREAVEAELTRRGKTCAVGKLGAIEKRDTVGLVDLKRLRAERPDIVAEYGLPGSKDFWSSRTLTKEERAC